MSSFPSGSVTLLFTDIEGSTRLWEEQPDAMSSALAVHDSILREEIERAGGIVFKTVGDAFHAAFGEAENALAAALMAQQRLLAAGLPFRVRAALHSGEPQLRDGDYFGTPLNRLARILATGHGGQILVSSATRYMAMDRLPAGAWLIEHGTHRLKDLAEPEDLFQLAHDDLPGEFPPLRSLSSHPQNLPAQLTSFIGREREIRELNGILDSGARLVTLTGSGGTGKTRIALQVAADRIEQYPGGVWWVDIAPVRDPALVVQEIAAALSVSEEAGKPIQAQVVERLSAARTLLLIDNFEQVVDAAVDLSDLLRCCPLLTVLVTSRAALNVSGEYDYGISELPMGDAVVLFASRAQQVQARFTLDDPTRAVVETICRRLDGIPLAIELAAAQARVFPPAQIERQLNQRFRTLVSPYRDVSGRQRTLRAAVDWSYDLLSDEERRLFALLSVFVGGFTFEAAEAVACSSDVYFGIARLREQSLLYADESASVPRFRLLETLREYGQEKLDLLGESSAARERHAAFFAGLAAREDERLESGGGEGGASETAEEYDNVRAALSWRVEEGRADDAAKMACSLSRFWEARGQFREARALLRRCLDLQSAIEDRRALARLLGWAGWFADIQGDHDESDRLQSQSLALCRETGDRHGECRALNHLALTAFNRRKYATARPLYEQSLAIARELGDRATQAARLNNLALLAMEEERDGDAATLLREALDIYAASHDSHGLAACHCNLGELAIRAGQWEMARLHLEESFTRFSRLEAKRGVAFSLSNLAWVYAGTGEAAAAKERAREALAICVETGMPLLVPGCLERLSVAESQMGHTEACAVAYCAAGRLRQTYGVPATASERKLVANVDLPDQSLERAESSMNSLSPEEIIAAVLNS